MRGSINTRQRCSKCGKKFTADSFDNVGFICASGCDTRPTRYSIIAKAFGCPEMYSDPQTGKIFETFSQALGTLIALNRDYDEAKAKGLRFRREKWIPAELAAKQVENICEQRLQFYQTEYERGKKSKTRIENVRKSFGFISDFFKDRDIRDIDEAEVEKFYLKLISTPSAPRGKQQPDPSKTLSSRYVADILNELKGLMLRYRPNDIPRFPEVEIEPAVRKQVIGVEREMSIMKHIPDRHGYRLAIEILLQTGMRINEVRALRRGDLVDGVIIVNKAIKDDRRPGNKRKAGGEVFSKVTTDLWTRLQTHVQGKRSDEFIFTIDGEPLGEGRLYKVLKKACADAGVEHISLQMASRHSTATRIKRKHDENAYAEIEDVLGHENRNTGKEHYIVQPNYSKN